MERMATKTEGSHQNYTKYGEGLKEHSLSSKLEELRKLQKQHVISIKEFSDIKAAIEDDNLHETRMQLAESCERRSDAQRMREASTYMAEAIRRQDEKIARSKRIIIGVCIVLGLIIAGTYAWTVL